MPIYSIQVEKHALGGLIKNPDIFPEVENFLTEFDFFQEVHATIFQVIRNSLRQGEKIDKVLLAEKIKNLGVKFKDDIDIFEYIEALSFTQITPKATLKACQELVKLRIRRQYHLTCNEIQLLMKNGGDKDIDELIALADAKFGERVNNYSTNDEPVNIFEDIEQMVEERGNSPLEETGLVTPYPEFNRLYGGLKNGNIYAIVSRPGQGKALEDNTLIPTPKGWTKIKDLKKGDEVYAEDGSITKVVGKRSWKNRPLYFIETSYQNFVLADENHEWKAKIDDDATYSYLNSKDLFFYKTKKKKIRFPVNKSLKSDKSYEASAAVVGEYLRVLNEKKDPLLKINQEYLRYNTESRLSLLQSFFNSDEPIYIHSENLKNYLLEAFYSLGLQAFSFRFDDLGYRIFYCDLSLKNYFELHSGQDLDKEINIHYYGKGNTTCIQIEHPSHIFLCGKDFTPTHNSTWINDLGFKTALLSNFKAKSLILDTEMETGDIKWRMVSSLTGVPMWFLETGNWRKDFEMVKKVRKIWPLIKNYQYHHYKVGNKNIDQICSVIRRWHFKHVGRGNPGLLCYDYIKLTGEKIGQNWAEHQAIGDKVDKLKKVAEEVNCPIITAMQLNRQGENHNKKGAEVTDDSSAISLSDRLQWFGTWVSIFRRKTLDEIQDDGEDFGTHKMVNLKSRFQGKDAAGHHDMLKRPSHDGKEHKYVYNYLNYNVNNFSVEEKGSLKHIIERIKRKAPLTVTKKDDTDTEII